MNTCPNCGKIAGLHSSILQGCMCQYMNQPKNAFDFSGASIWTRDKELSYINIGKINGSKRREKMRRTETVGIHPLRSKSKDGKS